MLDSWIFVVYDLFIEIALSINRHVSKTRAKRKRKTSSAGAFLDKALE